MKKKRVLWIGMALAVTAWFAAWVRGEQPRTLTQEEWQARVGQHVMKLHEDVAALGRRIQAVELQAEELRVSNSTVMGMLNKQDQALRRWCAGIETWANQVNGQLLRGIRIEVPQLEEISDQLRWLYFKP